MSDEVEEMKTVIAFIFGKHGKKELPENKFYFSLSMEMRWCNVMQAKNFVSKALSLNLMRKEGNMLKPNFSLEDISIPFGFRPSPSIFKFEEKDIFSRIADRCGISRDDLIKRAKEISMEKKLSEEVAALYYAYTKRKDVTEFLDEIMSKGLT
ncbi:MAG: DUF2240 family protein [Thermoplasmata archaeon]|nr:DUF2240 family protein [Thermoplasmata archaeon]